MPGLPLPSWQTGDPLTAPATSVPALLYPHPARSSQGPQAPGVPPLPPSPAPSPLRALDMLGQGLLQGHFPPSEVLPHHLA